MTFLRNKHVAERFQYFVEGGVIEEHWADQEEELDSMLHVELAAGSETVNDFTNARGMLKKVNANLSPLMIASRDAIRGAIARNNPNIIFGVLQLPLPIRIKSFLLLGLDLMKL